MLSISARLAILTSAILIFAGILGFFLLERLVRSTIEVQAEMSAGRWIKNIERTVPGLEALLSREAATAEQRTFIDTTILGTDVFEVHLFDRKGHWVYATGDGTNWTPGAYNKTAAAVAATGRTDLKVERQEHRADKPLWYVEAYMPVFAGSDELIGVAEIYINVSASAAALHNKFGWLTALTVAVTLLIVLLPGAGFVRQHGKLRRREAQLRELSCKDSLTGLLNRRGLQEELDKLCSGNSRGKRLWFLHIDLDKFKPVNDAFGHHTGDRLLCKTASRLLACTQSNDVVARVGGDEFLVCRSADSRSDCPVEFAEDIRRTVSQPVIFDGKSCSIGASIGISSWDPGEQQGITEALQNADIALNNAKIRGRNASVEFQAFMRARSVDEARVATDAIRGLKAGEFTAFFQPIFETQNRTLTGFEALVRWDHPELGMISPGKFLPACEAAGLSAEIDQAVLEQAMAFASQLKAMRRTEIQININLSTTQLKQPQIVDKYLRRLAAKGLAPGQFRIEVLETALIEERASSMAENIRRFSDAGFLIDLDDFGTGHTAIDSLRRFPVDRIKIDRSLVAFVDRDPKLAIVTEALVGLARKLDLSVLGEGVEREEEVEFLRNMGCTCVQGFLLGKPMPREECLELIDADMPRMRIA